MTMHWRAYEAGLPDAPFDMDDGRRAEAEGKLNVFLTAIKGQITSKIQTREIRWYKATALGEAPGPAVRVHPQVVVGTGANSPCPPQISSTITWRTALRKNWGRFYVPGIDSSKLSPTGRWLSTFVDLMQAAAVPLADRSSPTGSTTLCVWSPTENTHHDPQTCEVDDIPDVIRSRRFTMPVYKKVTGVG